MTRMHIVLLWLFNATVLAADPVADVASVAAEAFHRMPQVQTIDVIAGECGADQQVNRDVAFCTSRNVIFITKTAVTRPDAAYLVAHLYGHAVQVQHGVADFALAQISARRSEEQMLRGLVARQVECIAGFLVARTGQPRAKLTDWMMQEPFAGTRWGRDPLRIGPQVSIGLAERDIWFQRGQSGRLADCAAGELSADLLLKALKNP